MAKETFVEKRIGAAIFWILKGFEGKYADQLKTEYNNRNIWTGYVITLVFVLGLYIFLQ